MITKVGMRGKEANEADENETGIVWVGSTTNYAVKQGIAVWSVKEGEQRFENHVDKLTNYIRVFGKYNSERCGT